MPLPSSLRTTALFVFATFALGGCADEASVDDGAMSAESAQLVEGDKVLKIQYLAQQTSYWCGPGATRLALSARINPPAQNTLATVLRTDGDGTDSVADIVRGLNQYLGGNEYQARPLNRGGSSLDAAATSRLWDDLVSSIDANYPIVVNIVATPSVRPPHYPVKNTYHYVTAIGYNAKNKTAIISDPGRFGGVETFTVSLDLLSKLTAQRGYTTAVPKGTTCPGGNGSVRGEIEKKFTAIGGCGSPLGAPTSGEQSTPDGVGRFTTFQNGSIYWKDGLGAFAVKTDIRDAWGKAGYEAGNLGYPTSDEVATSDGVGRMSKFEKGGVYAKPKTGAHAIGGKIFAHWVKEGAERSDLGYPTSAEYDDAGLRRSDFEHGSIIWDPKTDAAMIKPR